MVPQSLQNVTITGGNSIAPNAFRNCHFIQNIVTPNTVTNIGHAAFFRCNNLQSITLPFVGNGSNVTNFGYIFGTSYFQNHNNVIPQSLKSVILIGGSNIVANAFREFFFLEHITIPSSVTSIGQDAFNGVSNLQTIINQRSNPQVINHTTFAGINRANVQVTVPNGTVQAFINAGWTGFNLV